MKAPGSQFWSALPVAALFLSFSDSVFATIIARTVGGDNTAASIQTTVDLFRADIGNPNNGNAAGSLFGGHREINWDGGGSTTTTSSGSPFFGFQNNRGALFTTPGTGFVQATPSGLATQFAQPTYATEFSAFSAQRLFTPVDSNITDVTFFVPGSSGTTPATVGGFGAVFADVDLPNATRLQFFGLSGAEIFNQTVAPSSVRQGGFSFLGGSGNAGEKIFRVRITAGNVFPGFIDANTGGTGLNFDPVLVDDFFYQEPTPIPEPTTVLFGVGLLAVCLGGRRRNA